MDNNDQSSTYRSRTDLCTLKWNPFNLILCFSSYVLIVYIGFNLNIWITLWSEAGNGNLIVQNLFCPIRGDFFYHLFKTMCIFGGGNELLALSLITLLFGRRPKFFYFIFAFTLEKANNGYLKLILHQPRPFYVNDKIQAYTCAKSFGCPSGHSSSSSFFAIIFFLDLFHGSERSLIDAQKLLQTSSKVTK